MTNALTSAPTIICVSMIVTWTFQLVSTIVRVWMAAPLDVMVINLQLFFTCLNSKLSSRIKLKLFVSYSKVSVQYYLTVIDLLS